MVTFLLFTVWEDMDTVHNNYGLRNSPENKYYCACVYTMQFTHSRFTAMAFRLGDEDDFAFGVTKIWKPGEDFFQNTFHFPPLA